MLKKKYIHYHQQQQQQPEAPEMDDARVAFPSRPTHMGILFKYRISNKKD